MAAKAVLLICAQIFLVQSISGYYMPEFAYGPGNFGLNGLDYAYGLEPFGYGPASLAYDAYANAGFGFNGFNGFNGLAASNGGALPVASASPIPASGVSVLSENRMEGPLAVAGELPFLGTVALEGPLPTAGAGVVSFGAGNGNVAMTREDARGYGRYWA